MTEFERNCFGISKTQIREEYMNGITARLSGLEMVAMSILSDAQEMLEHDMTKDSIRKQLNIAKFIISEIMDAKQTA